MNSVSVRKNDLLNIVEENRDNHRAKFEEAISHFRIKAISLLDEELSLARSGRTFNLRRLTSLEQPEDHTQEYDQILHMLNMEVNDVVTLRWDEYTNYVLDQWNWTPRFASTYNTYTGKSYK